MQAFGRNKYGRNLGALPPFWGGGWVPIEDKVPWAEAYLHTKWHLEPSSRLATVEMSRKRGRRAPPPFWRGAESQSRLG